MSGNSGGKEAFQGTVDVLKLDENESVFVDMLISASWDKYLTDQTNLPPKLNEQSAKEYAREVKGFSWVVINRVSSVEFDPLGLVTLTKFRNRAPPEKGGTIVNDFFKKNGNSAPRVCEIDQWLLESYRHKGIMCRAYKFLMPLLANDNICDFIIGLVYSNNQPSKKVLLKSGFSLLIENQYWWTPERDSDVAGWCSVLVASTKK